MLKAMLYWQYLTQYAVYFHNNINLNVCGATAESEQSLPLFG